MSYIVSLWPALTVGQSWELRGLQNWLTTSLVLSVTTVIIRCVTWSDGESCNWELADSSILFFKPVWMLFLLGYVWWFSIFTVPKRRAGVYALHYSFLCDLLLINIISLWWPAGGSSVKFCKILCRNMKNGPGVWVLCFCWFSWQLDVGYTDSFSKTSTLASATQEKKVNLTGVSRWRQLTKSEEVIHFHPHCYVKKPWNNETKSKPICWYSKCND